jgi:flagellar motility protein MotE (MotC chaperone)
MVVYEKRKGQYLGDGGATAAVAIIGVIIAAVSAGATIYSVVKETQAADEIAEEQERIREIQKETRQVEQEAAEILQTVTAAEEEQKKKSKIMAGVTAASVGAGALIALT